MGREQLKEKKVLKIAIFGCGKMGVHHLQIIKSLPNAKLVGIDDPRVNEKKIREIAGPGIFISSDTERLLDKVKPDVVHIVTPPDTHYAIGRLSVDNNIHVYIEKPFALQEKHAREIIESAMGKGLKICSGHQLLASEATRKGEEYVKNIGEIVHVESYFTFRKVRKSTSPVDQVIDILPHPVYTLLHFLRIGNEKEEGFLIKALDVEVDGEVRANIEHGKRKGILLVSLKGRPVDSYLKIVGTNGTVFTDYVRGVTINLSGSGADTLAAVITPYRQAWQAAWKTTKALTKMALIKDRSYEGLRELIDNFYQSILDEKEPIIKPDSIIETVAVCEKIGLALKEKESEAEERAKERLETEVKSLPAPAKNESVLVTGGTGFLGRAICRELRAAGWPVKAISRTLPPFSYRLPGVEYAAFDLADKISLEALEGVAAVIHCAAETSGGKEDHWRNSIEATQKVLEAAAAAGVKRFIHISSLAVLKPGKNSGRPLDETSPVDHDNLNRGPYVWGKAKAEVIAGSMSKQNGIDLKIIRPGPLVDFENFEPPGRLGREAGPFFVVMGSRRSPLSVCGVRTVAKVIKNYLEDYGSAPSLVNLTEPDVPSRRDLVLKFLERRRDLKALYIPTFLIKILSFGFKVFQKLISPSRKALDVAAAFASERYNTDLGRQVISKASLS